MGERAECAACALRIRGESHLANLVKRISLEDYKSLVEPPKTRRGTTFDYSHYDTIACKHCGSPLKLQSTVRVDDRARTLVCLLLSARLMKLEAEEWSDG